MPTIGDWVKWYDDVNCDHVAQVIGFELDGHIRLFVYPENAGPAKVAFTTWDRCNILTREEMTDMPMKNAYDEGYELGVALRDVFGTTKDYTSNPQSVFSLGRRFASMMGYGNLEEGFKFIEGFVVAFQVHTKQIPEPEKTQD